MKLMYELQEIPIEDLETVQGGNGLLETLQKTVTAIDGVGTLIAVIQSPPIELLLPPNTTQGQITPSYSPQDWSTYYQSVYRDLLSGAQSFAQDLANRIIPLVPGPAR